MNATALGNAPTPKDRNHLTRIFASRFISFNQRGLPSLGLPQQRLMRPDVRPEGILP